MTTAHILPPLLLIGSNVLMTFAWYGHLKVPSWPLWLAVLMSWGIAFFEYCLAVPANRIGYASGAYTGQQLKIMQEVITLSVFAGFSVLWLGEPIRWTYLAAMACLVAAVVFIFLPVD
ncbi:MAG: DMT family protein [Acetobacteraceae bacterium]|nr:DMT family protein [Acetobacteraceae bacterium]